MVAENYRYVLKKVEEACARSGRDPKDVTLIAVSKTKPIEMIEEAMEAGARVFGENKVQELCDKYEQLPKDLHWHLIGHLQRNKVKYIVDKAELIHSVDSLKLAQSISQHASEIGKVQKILVQINNANEEQKFGFSKEEIFEVLPEILKLPSVEVVGVMNMAPLGIAEEEIGRLFEEIKEIRNFLEEQYGCKLPEISMGMSQDYYIAVKHGATMLRIGRKLFK